MTEAIRHRIYQIAFAIIGALAFYGIIGTDEIPVWLGIVVAVLGLSTNALAVKNTTPLPPPPPRFDRG